jgi:2-dehydropantoate 2-reductase
MKVTIVGSGAIGGLAGAWMTMAGEDVTLVDVWREHVDAMRERGLFIDGLRGEHRVRVKAITPDKLERPLELVFLACKSQHTRAATEGIKPFLAEGSAVVSLQNGMNEEIIGAVIGMEKVIGAIPDYGGALVAPVHLEFVHPGPATIGELDGAITARVSEAHRLLSLLTETTLSDNIVGQIWAKQVHSSQVVMTALVDAPITEVQGHDWVRHLAVSLIAEGIAVADAAGVTLPEGATIQPDRYRARSAQETQGLMGDLAAWVQSTLHHQAEQEAAGGHTYVKKGSGMWWDLYYRRRQSETRGTTGVLLERADALGIPMPLTHRLAQMIYGIEDGTRQPGYGNLEELYAFGRSHGMLLPLSAGSTVGNDVRA